MTPQNQEREFSEVIHTKTNKCDKCPEVSSVKTAEGGHLCINHYLEKEG